MSVPFLIFIHIILILGLVPVLHTCKNRNIVIYRTHCKSSDDCCGCIELYNGIIIQGFLSFITCFLGTALVATADESSNPFYHIYNFVVKEHKKHTIIEENIKIINILIIVSGVIYGFCCLLLMIGAALKKPRVCNIGFL